jgi:hypothetical protein
MARKLSASIDAWAGRDANGSSNAHDERHRDHYRDSKRTPLSKQRNKHIQYVLVEAAKRAPKQSHELALVYERAKEKGNVNRATIAVARKMVTYLLAVDRANRPFAPTEKHSTAAA